MTIFVDIPLRRLPDHLYDHIVDSLRLSVNGFFAALRMTVSGAQDDNACLHEMPAHIVTLLFAPSF